MNTHSEINATAAEHVYHSIIIGSGFAGLGMGRALRLQGIDDFLILEKAQDVGGVWRDNSYPGAACDVPSHLYSFSFFPNPAWTRKFAPQGEIYTYLQSCVQQFGLQKQLQLSATVTAAHYDDAQAQWQVELADGRRLHCQFLMTAMGQLSRPSLPSVPGAESFQGKTFHSAQWDHSFDLSGKRVAVIGTGASAIQFVPAIAQQVAEMTVFQRSPAYILPRPDRPYTKFELALCKYAPWLMRLHRLAIYIQYESRALGFTRFKGLMKFAAVMPFQKHLKQQIADTALRAKMVPDYPIGCKRILLSSEYLATFNQTHVKLVTDGIQQITPTGVQAKDGKHYEVDAIVYGTGFAATEFLAPLTITGKAGKNLNETWSQGAKAYLGMTVPDFPNFFMLYGPNTSLGHNSIVYMLESQIAHVSRCLQQFTRNQARTIEVVPGAYTQYTAQIQKDLAHTVWNGCKSWYVDENGYNSTTWPGFTLAYRWLTRTDDLSAYRFSTNTSVV